MSLSEWQYRALHGWLGSPMRRLHRLRNRLDRVGFLPSDELYRKLTIAINAMHDLLIELHYRSCGKIDGGPARSAHQRLIGEDVTEGERRES